MKVGKKIEADSDNSYSICARVTMAELNGGQEDTKQDYQTASAEETRRALFKLGEQRSLAVKEFLLKNFKIAEERLLICNPGINFDKGGKPIIEFMQ